MTVRGRLALRQSLHDARSILLKPGDPAMLVFCCLLITINAVTAFMFASNGAFNYNIYHDIAWFVNAHGTLPNRSQVLAPSITGAYADFTAPSLSVYRAVFSFHGANLQRAIYLAYEGIAYMIGVAILLRRRTRLGLSDETARLTALLVSSPVMAGWTMIFLEDKALFFALPVLVLASTAKFGKRAALLGLAAGWGGLSVLTIALLPLAAREGSRAPDRVKALWRSMLGLAVFIVSTLLAGGASLQLLRNRATRESGSLFWFPIWRLLGGSYSPVLRDLVMVAVGGTLIWAAYAGQIKFEEGFVALTALLLISSTNTSPIRIVCFLPLGIFVFRTDARRRLYLAAVAAWAAAMLVFALAAKFTDIGMFASPSSSSYEAAACKALVVNALLLIILAQTLKSAIQAWRQKQPQHSSETARLAHAVGA
jgi:hypothetical protein